MVHSPEKPARRHDIDALRVLAVLLLIYFHSARAFDHESWHIKNGELSKGLGTFVGFVDLWHMPLFFLLAGASTWLALGRRSGRQYILERVRRLFVALLFGCLVVVPPQVYVERISPWSAPRQSPINFEGTYLQFYTHFFSGIYPEGNFSWHHLWFVAYLLTYSLVALPLVLWMRRPKRGQPFIHRLTRAMAEGPWLLLACVPIIVAEMVLRGKFSTTHALYNDWAAHAHFILVFLYGCLLISDERISEAVRRLKGLALALALVSAAVLWLAFGAAAPYSPRYFAQIAGWIACQWCWLLAILGYGQAHLNRPHPLLPHAAEIAYPFYILHQTVIVVLAHQVVRWHASVAVKFLVLSTASLAATVVLCELVRQFNVTRFLFGMPAKRRLARTDESRPESEEKRP
ncbi:MAG TPA: acyltransferase [Phycisphaerae bacterium]|nr:acyltransferase [Phycisphaerae bacterium]HSA30042.1 acyltransferase [Phycisphaerae bacterium]